MEKRQTPAKEYGKATLYPKTAAQRRKAAPFSAVRFILHICKHSVKGFAGILAANFAKIIVIEQIWGKPPLFS